MSPRLPFLVLLVGMTALGVRSASGIGGERGEGGEPGAGGAGAQGRMAAASEAPPVPTEPALTWYCSAGTAGGFADHTVIVHNPHRQPARGRIVLFSNGRPSKPSRLSVPAGEELRVRLDDLAKQPERRESFVAALVEMDQAVVVVEHEVEGDEGSATGPCASRGAPEWHFAWGATSRDARDLLVLFNPFPSDVVVDAVFTTPAGRREPLRWQGLIVPGRQVVAIDVGDDVTRRSQVAATIRARQGSLIAERLTLFDGSLDLQGARLTRGQPEPTMTASLPGGLEEDGQELVVLYNPSAEATAEVDVLVRPEDAASPEPSPFRLVVRPGDFEVLDYAEEPRVKPGEAHVTQVSSTNGVPVVAEHVRIDADGKLSP